MYPRQLVFALSNGLLQAGQTFAAPTHQFKLGSLADAHVAIPQQFQQFGSCLISVVQFHQSFGLPTLIGEVIFICRNVEFPNSTKVFGTPAIHPVGNVQGTIGTEFDARRQNTADQIGFTF